MITVRLYLLFDAYSGDDVDEMLHHSSWAYTKVANTLIPGSTPHI